jgi:hypothetical protein
MKLPRTTEIVSDAAVLICSALERYQLLSKLGFKILTCVTVSKRDMAAV